MGDACPARVEGTLKRDPCKVAISISLLASVVMLVGKLTAYLLTHSAAIFSDAAESVVHSAATGLAAYSLWYAARPADAGHPYGHGRIAYFSAGFEGALVLAAAVAVISSGVVGLIRGPHLRHLGLGLAIAGTLALINLALGLALVSVGRKHNALILVANGKHVLSDMWTTGAVIVGVGLVLLTGITWLDPVAAICIGLYIMATGVTLVRKAFAGLMDEVQPELSRRLMNGLRTTVREGLIVDFHQLRCRQINDQVWVDVHVLVPGESSTLEAHARVTRAEQSIRDLFPDDMIHITSHIEPTEHTTAHPAGHEGISDPLRPE
ncbi:MAG: cation diffusion facilitator family transporter [Phycisphaerae bacterium]